MKILVVLALCLGVVNLCLTFLRPADQKVVFADSVRLFNEFDMKKEMEKEYDMELQSLKRYTDSIKALIDTKGGAIGSNNKLVDKYNLLRAQFNDRFQEARTNINTTGWKRLNPIIFKFGKEHDYEVIVGGNGMGAVLFGKPTVDITDALIKYINKEYHGK